MSSILHAESKDWLYKIIEIFRNNLYMCIAMLMVIALAIATAMLEDLMDGGVFSWSYEIGWASAAVYLVSATVFGLRAFLVSRKARTITCNTNDTASM